MKKDITSLFCFVDDFVKLYERIQAPKSLEGRRKPTRVPELSTSEIITITLMFQSSPSKNFKYFYKSYLQQYKGKEFSALPSYERFVILKQRVLLILLAMLHFLLSSGCSLAYIDATGIRVCHSKRIRTNKVFEGFARIGKTTKGWFFGFKLHLIISTRGELVNMTITPGNIDDRVPVEKLAKKLKGVLYGDKGYISKKLFEKLLEQDVRLITNNKQGMKNTFMKTEDRIALKKRSIIETVFGYLKETMQLEHTRHRSIVNALIHIFATLITYQRKSKKPCVNFGNLIAA